jgi:hypothetical protein
MEADEQKPYSRHPARLRLQSGKPIGYPFGSIPRLLLFWITTEAVQTKVRRLELGKSP